MKNDIFVRSTFGKKFENENAFFHKVRCQNKKVEYTEPRKLLNNIPNEKSRDHSSYTPYHEQYKYK